MDLLAAYAYAYLAENEHTKMGSKRRRNGIITPGPTGIFPGKTHKIINSKRDLAGKGSATPWTT